MNAPRCPALSPRPFFGPPSNPFERPGLARRHIARRKGSA